MDEGKAAKILLRMKPERAAKLTAILAKEPAANVVASR
jgi:flagellar motility protein MotE (MotC chaperone)